MASNDPGHLSVRIGARKVDADNRPARRLIFQAFQPLSVVRGTRICRFDFIFRGFINRWRDSATSLRQTGPPNPSILVAAPGGFDRSAVAGPHPRFLLLGGFAPRTGRRRSSTVWLRTCPKGAAVTDQLTVDVSERRAGARVRGSRRSSSRRDHRACARRRGGAVEPLHGAVCERSRLALWSNPVNSTCC